MKLMIAAVFLVVFLVAPVQAELSLFSQIPEDIPPEGRIFVDARPESACIGQSLAESVCLPVELFVSAEGRLANLRDIRWLLGALGMTGGEIALVISDDPQRRDIVAAVLYLAGQRKVIRSRLPVSSLLQKGQLQRGPSRRAAFFRVVVFQEHVRDRWLVATKHHSAYPDVVASLAHFSEAFSIGTQESFQWPILVAEP